MKAPAIALVCVALFACDKGENAPNASALPADEAALFKQLPAGGNVVFGGNYMGVQKKIQESLGQAMEAMGPGFKAWMDCWTGARVKMVGTASFSSGGGEMRSVFSGMNLAQLKNCAEKAGFKPTMDPDGKFLTTEMTMMGKTVTQGILQLPSGVLYTRQSVGFPAGAVVPATRAELETDAAQAAKKGALDDAQLQALVAKVDHSKSMWFAGTAAGTSIADKLGSIYGSFDITTADLAFDVSAEVLDSTIADKIEKGVAMLKDHVDQMPAEMRATVKGLTVKRSGKNMRMIARISSANLQALMMQAAALRGM